MSVLLSDNLLLFAWNLAWLLMLSVVMLFLLICWKHWRRYRRYKSTVGINQLLERLPDPDLFREPNLDFHAELKSCLENDYLDLIYAWVRFAQKLESAPAAMFIQNSARCGMFDLIGRNLGGSDPARICVALEVCGLARLSTYVPQVEGYTWKAIYAPFACHALVRMDFQEGMSALFRAYGRGLVNNAELLIVCSEFDKSALLDWAKETLHMPLPEVLRKYWVVV